MRKIIEACPTCGDRLTITEVSCDTCGTQVRSRYSPCPFCSLTEEEQTFLLLFVRSRGNLKELEKTLGVSYPTVRAKLDELIQNLEQPTPDSPAASRQAILNQLRSGQLSADQALALLKQAPPAPGDSTF
ncbi:MAG: DUF2089 domain-containing protein [Chloroflexota bacterium]|nr:DUF2089 domain-containing protein [Chloroflexota bacterium]